MPTVYYRTEDPVENLKIRVVVREVSRAKLYNDDGSKVQPFYTDCTLSWQEKLYSPGEIGDYVKSKNGRSGRSGTAAQIEARRHLGRLQEEGGDAKDMLQGVMLYTYVDKDNFRAEKPPPLFDPGDQEPYLGAAVRNLGSVHRGSARERGISQNLFRNKPFKAMHVCLATDVDEKVLGWSWDSSADFHEHVLCTLRIFQDGLIEVTPSFSGVIEEESTVAHNEASSLSVFLDDSTAESGLKKGFRLGSFRVRSRTGAEFEYVIQNLNDLLIPHKIEAIYAKKAANDAIKAAENRGVVGYEGWRQDPSNRDKSVSINAEIVSGRGFVGDNLFVCYELSLPTAWQQRKGDLTDRVASDTGGRGGGGGDDAGGGGGKRAISGKTAADLELMRLGKRLRLEGDEGMLQGTTHTARVSSALRTSSSLPFHRPLWRGLHLAFVLPQGTRVFIGGSFFLATVLAVVLGIEYPLWLLPAMVILFVLGTGAPGAAPEVVLCVSKSKGAQRPQYHLPQARQVLGGGGGGGGLSDWAAFNHLMSFSFDVWDAGGSGKGGAGAGIGGVGGIGGMSAKLQAPSSSMPTLIIQVYSTSWGRHILEGYGYHHLSDTPGMVDIDIKTWKPVGTVGDKMRDFFLGNSLRLKEAAFVESVNKTAKALNRFGMLTSSSGSIRIRTHTLIVDARTIGDQHREANETQQANDSSLKVRRTVDDILKSFKSSMGGTGGLGGTGGSMGGTGTFTPGKLSRSGSGLGTGGGMGATPKGRPSVGSILSSLNSSARDTKLNDLLARARAKNKKPDGGGDVGGGKEGNLGKDKDVGGSGGGGGGIAGGGMGGVGGGLGGQLDLLRRQLPKSNFGAPRGGGAGAGAGMGAGAGAGAYDPFIERSQGAGSPGGAVGALGAVVGGAVGAVGGTGVGPMAAMAAGPGGAGGGAPRRHRYGEQEEGQEGQEGRGQGRDMPKEGGEDEDAPLLS